jgi:hypothetical protein
MIHQVKVLILYNIFKLDEKRCFKGCPKNYFLEEKNNICETILLPSFGPTSNNTAQMEKMNNISEGILKIFIFYLLILKRSH